jgi:branched-chain amino acid transport system ATP-binding protein
MGRNGTGKTTVINSVIGFVHASQGTVRFRGIDITRTAPDRIARMGIGLVPQGRRIFPSLSVKENLVIAERTGSRRKARWDLDTVLSVFPALKERLNARGYTLSGGELQMLAIARALMTNPNLLLLDEASDGLSPVAMLELMQVVGHLRQEEGLSVLLVAQNPKLALDLSDYVYVMSKGKVAHASKPSDLVGNPDVMAKYLGL